MESSTHTPRSSSTSATTLLLFAVTVLAIGYLYLGALLEQVI
jgi:hypothetical protein